MSNQSTSCCDDNVVENSQYCGEAAVVTATCCGDTATVSDDAAPAASCCGTAEQTASDRDLRSILQPLWSAWSLIVLIPLAVALLAPNDLAEVLRIASTAFIGTAPYIVFAVLLIAYLKATGAESMVAQAFVGRENRMIVLAALFGGLAPFCSCEVIPFIAGLLALGAPVSAVMAFWLSSPLIDPPSLMITAGALGWEFALGKAVSAVALGLFGGFGVKAMMSYPAFSTPLRETVKGGCSSGTCGVDRPFSAKPTWDFWRHSERRGIFAEQSIENGLFLVKWLAFAYLLEALLILYVPASLIGGIVGGDGVGAVALAAVVGMSAYLNSYAAPPLVAGLMEQGMSAGAAMAFMVAGAISSIPAMTAVWSLVKKPVFFAYLGFGVSGAILFGLLFALVV